MHLLGIHLADCRVTAVIVDGDGRVLRRGQRAGLNATEASAALMAEIGGDGPIDARGVAVDRRQPDVRRRV